MNAAHLPGASAWCQLTEPALVFGDWLWTGGEPQTNLR
jgi:hypothetical protein